MFYLESRYNIFSSLFNFNFFLEKFFFIIFDHGNADQVYISDSTLLIDCGCTFMILHTGYTPFHVTTRPEVYCNFEYFGAM